LYVYLTEGGTIKPLIICGGCSFTHSPDSWAQVLGNFRMLWNNTAQLYHDNWYKYGKDECGANMDNVPKNIYDVWEAGEDITQYADVMVVGQGASGNGLNSRLIRKAIEQNAGRKIIVLWQLSGWQRKEYAINYLDTVDYDTIINEHEAHHMYSIVDAQRFRNCTHIDGLEHDPKYPSANGFRMNEEMDPTNGPELTPDAFRSNSRVWLKQGGSYSGWDKRRLYDFFKEDSINLDTTDNQCIRNLETIEYMKLFCESRNVQLLTFPGWYWTWLGNFHTVGSVENSLFSRDILDRLTLDAVDNIDGFGGIAEWCIKDEKYKGTSTNNMNPTVNLSSGYEWDSNETSSVYEKAQLDDGTWWCGNHPSAYSHATFCNGWLKPKVKEMLDNIL